MCFLFLWSLSCGLYVIALAFVIGFLEGVSWTSLVLLVCLCLLCFMFHISIWMLILSLHLCFQKIKMRKRRHTTTTWQKYNDTQRKKDSVANQYYKCTENWMMHLTKPHKWPINDKRQNHGCMEGKGREGQGKAKDEFILFVFCFRLIYFLNLYIWYYLEHFQKFSISSNVTRIIGLQVQKSVMPTCDMPYLHQRCVTP